MWTLMEQVPRNHGKSSADRRPIRQVIADAGRADEAAAARIREALTWHGASRGRIEVETLRARTPRMRAAAVCRHM